MPLDFFLLTLEPRIQGSMSLKYEPYSELLHISAKKFLLNRHVLVDPDFAAEAGAAEHGCSCVSPSGPLLSEYGTYQTDQARFWP